MDAARGRRMPIVARLLAAFLLVSLLPIGLLAALSFAEAREPADEHEGEAEGEAGDEHELLGIAIEVIELAVAVAGLALSVLVALYLARTLVRPLRELERGIARVQAGDLRTRVTVRSNDEIGELAAAFNAMTEGLEREALVRDLFGQYVTPELAAAAIEHRGRLDGQLVTSTVLFADIRDFTGVSEALPASRLIAVLNRYFDRMSAVVVSEGGMVNKFGGDSLLAIFGSPLNPSEDHAARAVRAALGMEAALEEFNREQAEAFLPEIMVGIGLATGDVVAGNVGSTAKVEYTVIGDAVNVAARLQGLSKELNETIVVSAETAAAARSVAAFEPIGEVEVRGKRRPVRVTRIARADRAGQPSATT